MEFGFPEITNSFLQGQDVLYSQFNSVNFYVEDQEQENFYYVILKKLFPGVLFEKIFPLGGKDNVLLDATENFDNKKKVYLLDLDFDEILNKKIIQPNVFYLEKYSIENYLVDGDAVKEIIKEERPKLKDAAIDTIFHFQSFLDETKNLFAEIVSHYLVIQRHSLSIENVNQDTARFCDFTKTPACLKNNSLINYGSQIEAALRLKNKRVKFPRQLHLLRKHTSNTVKAINNIPGKYILNFLKYRVEHLFSYPQVSLESFTYRLAKNCSLTNLFNLRDRVNLYIK